MDAACCRCTGSGVPPAARRRVTSRSESDTKLSLHTAARSLQCKPMPCHLYIISMQFNATTPPPVSACRDNGRSGPCEGVDDNTAWRAGRLHEELSETLWHDSGVLASRALELVVGLIDRDHVSWVRTVLVIGLGAVTPEAGLSVSAPVLVSAPPFYFGTICAVRHPHRVEIEKWGSPLGEVIHILEAVFRTRTESPWNRVWF